MIRIDCDTRETALNTIASFYEIDPLEIDKFFTTVNIDKIYHENRNACRPADRMLKMLFENKFGSPRHKIQEVCWFHLTRTYANNPFEEGILPLGEVLEKIWNTLLSIFRDTDHYSNLLNLKKHGVKEEHYGLKVPDKLHWGPYAMLIKDSAFHYSSIGNHDYLRLPEIIEDICNGYAKSFGIKLHEVVTSSLKPCIVKFISNKNINDDLFDPIILYLYLTNKGEDMCIDSNRCFNGDACLIPFDNIVKFYWD